MEEHKWNDANRSLPNSDRKVEIIVRVWYGENGYNDFNSIGELHMNAFIDKPYLYDLNFLNGRVISWREINK